MKNNMAIALIVIGTVTIALFALVLGAFVFSGKDDGADDLDVKVPVEQNLTEQQQSKAIDIALNDEIVKEKILSVASLKLPAGGYPVNVSYHTGEVTISGFSEGSLGVSTIRMLPTVEIIFDNNPDINMYAFVDLEKERVAYIGFTCPSDPGARPPFSNVSIINTGYTKGYLTEEMASEAIDIARNNDTVKKEIYGKPYSVSRIGLIENEVRLDNRSSYIEVKPVVDFLITREDNTKYILEAEIGSAHGSVSRILYYNRIAPPGYNTTYIEDIADGRIRITV